MHTYLHTFLVCCMPYLHVLFHAIYWCQLWSEYWVCGQFTSIDHEDSEYCYIWCIVPSWYADAKASSCLITSLCTCISLQWTKNKWINHLIGHLNFYLLPCNITTYHFVPNISIIYIALWPAVYYWIDWKQLIFYFSWSPSCNRTRQDIVAVETT